MRKGGPGKPNKKVANSLVAMSSAAVLAVYAAGYVRTRPAAERLMLQAADRRPAVPSLPNTVAPIADDRPAAPDGPSNAPLPAASASSDLKRKPIAAPIPAASSEPPQTKAEVPSAAAAPSPVEMPAPPPGPVAATAPAAPVATPPADPVPAAVEPKVESPAAAPAVSSHSAWKDGMYHGWGTSRHGNIQAAVVIEGGRIASATIAQCLTRYSCDVIDKLPPQVALRQSPDVDTVSGATQSADAFYYAVADALSKAK